MSVSENVAGPAVRIGIDLGGTKIEGVMLDRSGAERARLRVAAPRNDYNASIEAIAGLVAGLESAGGERASVGIGMPGAITKRSGLVQNANSTWLNGRPLGRDLEARLDRPVRLANDANCFAKSEAVDGAAAGKDRVFGVILGTGCGGGIVLKGEIIDGPLGIGGEWGHNPLPWATSDETPGPRCWCGRHGCMETWVSGPALTDDHRRATGVVLPAEGILAAAAQGDPAALATRDRHASRLARGLASVVNMLDPDVIVLGGGLSQAPHLYEMLPDLMLRHIFSDEPAITIRAPRWGDASGVRGAAWLWP